MSLIKTYTNNTSLLKTISYQYGQTTPGIPTLTSTLGGKLDSHFICTDAWSEGLISAA